MSALATYQQALTRLVVAQRAGRASPHKICLLLAVLDLARAGGLPVNRIVFGPPLLERYHGFFNAVKQPGDHANPYFPFFHLAGKLRGGGASFWHLVPQPGRETVLAAMSTARSLRDITDNIAWAELDADLFALLQQPEALDALGQTLAGHWFDRGLQELGTIAAQSEASSRYEYRLRHGEPLTATEPPPAWVRDPAFRRVVTEAYDWRCAATGLRILLPTGESLVEAAHIHPFSAAGDDDPRNGLALTPDMHWALDRHLIAPGEDLLWHVSPLLDRRIPDYAPLVRLDSQPLILPTERRYAPKRDALAWRMAHLRRPAP
ncbi:MAG: HNH endonuclease [Burkholderiaceae bacterium]|nr:HNH endonuclease [Burkholderiaceae bacterium]